MYVHILIFKKLLLQVLVESKNIVKFNSSSFTDICLHTRIGRSSGYKVSELESMEEGQSLLVGGKEIEV